MSQAQDATTSNVLGALQAALTSGKISALKEVKPNAVLLDEAHALPELLRLCGSVETGQNLPLMNTAWKLLLSVASLTTISASLYSEILRFMLSQLEHHVFSHNWLDGRKIKLTSFVASHVVSAVRAHPSLAVLDKKLVETVVGLHTIACLTVATSEHWKAARHLHQSIIVRLLAILEAMGSSCSASNSFSAEQHLRLLLQSLALPSPDATAELPTASVAAGSSIAALAASLAVTRSFQVCDRVYAERVLSAFLLWLPDMQLAFFDLGDHDETTESEAATGVGGGRGVMASYNEDSISLLCHRIMQHARNIPPGVFNLEKTNAEDSELSGEINLNSQLLLVLRSLACRSADSIRGSEWCETEGASTCGVPLLHCRPFSLLMTALLVPNDASTARVLLVWEAVLNRLSAADQEGLGVELLELGEEQLSALHEFSVESCDQAMCLRRFLKALAVLLAEICRRLQCPPKLLYESLSETSPARVILPDSISFCSLVSVLYQQSCVYQWWNEKKKVTKPEITTGGTEMEATMLLYELQNYLTEWQQDSFSLKKKHDMMRRFCGVLGSVPERVHSILERTSSSSSIMGVLLASTRLLQSVAEDLNSPHAICVCARFVAAELVAVAGFAPSDDPTFLACVRRLVDLSFGITEDGKEIKTEGMLRYHAAVCLRNFAQRNTVVPLDKLRLSETVTTALLSVLQGATTTAGDTDAVDMRGYTELLSYRLEEWHNLLSRCNEAITNTNNSMNSFANLAPQTSCTSSQNITVCHEGRFLSSLQQSEDTVRSVLQWLEAGNALQPSEEAGVARLEQLVSAAANMMRTTLGSNGSGPCSPVNMTMETTQTQGSSPGVIHVD